MLGRHVNWDEISLASGLEQTSTELRRIAQDGVEAISRWLAESGPGRTQKALVRSKRHDTPGYKPD
jgi:hypothetical protein